MFRKTYPSFDLQPLLLKRYRKLEEAGLQHQAGRAKRSSEKSEVLVTVSVLEAKSCGAETVPKLVTSICTSSSV